MILPLWGKLGPQILFFGYLFFCCAWLVLFPFICLKGWQDPAQNPNLLVAICSNPLFVLFFHQSCSKMLHFHNVCSFFCNEMDTSLVFVNIHVLYFEYFPRSCMFPNIESEWWGGWLLESMPSPFAIATINETRFRSLKIHWLFCRSRLLRWRSTRPDFWRGWQLSSIGAHSYETKWRMASLR